MVHNAEATHEYDDGSEISVGFNRHGQAQVVMDGPGGLETVIRFDQLHVRERFIEFRRAYRVGETRPSGSLEGGTQNYGEVGEWFDEHDGELLEECGTA